jgi:hypothetical protein
MMDACWSFGTLLCGPKTIVVCKCSMVRSKPNTVADTLMSAWPALAALLLPSCRNQLCQTRQQGLHELSPCSWFSLFEKLSDRKPANAVDVDEQVQLTLGSLRLGEVSPRYLVDARNHALEAWV